MDATRVEASIRIILAYEATPFSSRQRDVLDLSINLNPATLQNNKCKLYT